MVTQLVVSMQAESLTGQATASRKEISTDLQPSLFLTLLLPMARDAPKIRCGGGGGGGTWGLERCSYHVGTIQGINQSSFDLPVLGLCCLPSISIFLINAILQNV